MAGWHHRLDGHGFGQTLAVGDGRVAWRAVVHGVTKSWTIKKAEHQRTDTFELCCWKKLLKSPLDCKEINPVNPKGNQSLIFIGRTDAEAEPPILWPPDMKSRLIRKDPDAGKD